MVDTATTTLLCCAARQDVQVEGWVVPVGVSIDAGEPSWPIIHFPMLEAEFRLPHPGLAPCTDVNMPGSASPA